MKKTVAKTIPSAKYQTRDLSGLVTGITLFLSKLSSKWQNSSNPTITELKKRKIKKFIPAGILLIAIGIVLVVSTRTLTASSKNTTQADQPITVKGPIKTMEINKQLEFPLTDAKGKELTKIKYTVVSAELRDEIIVKGARARTVEGRVFLILNISIDNRYDKSLNINTRDYVRLMINGNAEGLLAADIHNDPVSVQAISVKNTRIGFPINTTDTNLVLKVGEITGDKEDIALNF